MDAKRAAALLALVLGCGPRRLAPPVHEPLPEAAGHPERVALGELDGAQVLGAADGDKLVVCKLDGSGAMTAPAGGAPQQLVIGRVGDASAVVAGWGMDRAHRDAHARVIAYLEQGGGLRAETVLEPQTTRNDIQWLRLCDWPGEGPALLWAVFDSKYFVRVGLSSRHGTWRTRELGRWRMVSAVDLADGRLVVGRLYGDDAEKDGDAFLVNPDGSHTMLPTTRGLRSLVARGREIFVGDGWHKMYAAKARGLVTRIVLGSPPRAQLVEDTTGSPQENRDVATGQFMVHKLALADLDGDGTPELLGVGPRALLAWTRRGDRFRKSELARGVTDFDAARGVVVTAGPKPELLRWR